MNVWLLASRFVTISFARYCAMRWMNCDISCLLACFFPLVAELTFVSNFKIAKSNFKFELKFGMEILRWKTKRDSWEEMPGGLSAEHVMATVDDVEVDVGESMTGLHRAMRKIMLTDGERAGRPKRVEEIQFGLMSGLDMMQVSELHVRSKQLYVIETREPVSEGLLDPKLGVSDKSSLCGTCGKSLKSCVGHFGHIDLGLPVFHIGYFKAIQAVLHSICKTCSRVLLANPEKDAFLGIMTSRSIDSNTKTEVRKKIVDLCKKVRACPTCKARNGAIKKVQGSDTLKLVHELYKTKKAKEDDHLQRIRKNMFATSLSKETAVEIDEAMIDRAQGPMDPEVVRKLFANIPGAELPLLWSDPTHSRPERMILTHLLVPPVAIRPSAKVETQGTNEDDLTSKLQEIVDCNNELKKLLSQGGKSRKVYEHWNWLQVRVSQFLNGELPGLSPQIRREQKVIRGLVQRLKGKQGRFRGNLSGKRVDFSGRTVISPDPNLCIEEVGVPVDMAKKLTFPERVNAHNLEKLRKAIINGAEQHPGANWVKVLEKPRSMLPGDGVEDKQQQELLDKEGRLAKNLTYLRREGRKELAKELKIGDTVERHIHDGDIVLFNRQPSLHKMSIMSHRVRVLEGRTLRFNECVCAPYNADFDGDEMNLHVPQTEEARSEAANLMGVHENIITPRNGEPLITATQDFITAAFLLTSRDVFLTREEFAQTCATIGDAREHLDLPQPAVLKPVPLWTGKQVWSVLLKPNRASTLKVNLEANERFFNKKFADDRWMCDKEGFVVIRNSELCCGQLGKNVLGSSKSGLIYVLIRDHSKLEAARMMNRMTKVCTRWLTKQGFTIGLEDVCPSEELLERKQQEIWRGYKECKDFIQQFENGTLKKRPGCNMDESLESEISAVLSKVRDTAGKICMETLPKVNKPFIMATAGSKGSALNICQMMVCVGQQIVGGKRMPYGFVRRTLPHFKEFAKEPEARGFVKNSFYSGLTAPEFFFHTMAGREGLVDTAVKTAETGYMARRLMKALEDLSVQYDGTVRNAVNGIVQFNYGDDGLDPSSMERGDRPVDWERLERVMKPKTPALESDEKLTPRGMRDIVAEAYCSWPKILETTGLTDTAGSSLQFAADSPGVRFFMEEMQRAVERYAARLHEMANRMGMDLDGFGGCFPAPYAFENPVDVLALHKVYHFTRKQVEAIIKEATIRFIRAMTEPGEAVGAIGAQSLGEPGTQMTLKTFHFAGVASMNVTLGVPRIKEIINASTSISTPIITVKLVNEKDVRSARIVQGRLEATKLGEIIEYIEERVDSFDGCSIVVKLDTECLAKLRLHVTPASVRDAIQNQKIFVRSKKSDFVHVNIGTDRVSIKVTADMKIGSTRASTTSASADPASRKKIREDLRSAIPLGFNMKSVKQALKEVIVSGIPSVHRAVVNHDEEDETKYEILVEGSGLRDVLGTSGVDFTRTKTNHVMEMEEVIGIEAARDLVQREVAYIFGRYGLSIDQRHLMLLADVMSYRGSILGITRFGIAKMKESVLMLASFEKTADHLFDAAAHSRKDQIDGVSECIIMGAPIPLGTGKFKIKGVWENKTLTMDPFKSSCPCSELINFL